MYFETVKSNVMNPAAHCPQNLSTHSISAFLSRYYWLIVSMVAAVQMVAAAVVDFRRKLWIDELYTLLTANQKNIWEIIKATIEGCDGAPPMYAILVHALLPLFPSEEFAVRLWATIGYGAMVLLTAAFFRRIFSASYALAAVFLICLCTFEYAYEGRGYGLALGFAGCALYCWRIMAENKPSAWSRAFFVLSAAMMTALHFYAMLFFVPLFLADLDRGYRGGRMNWKVWTATAAAIVIVLCMHYSIIAASRKFLQYYWAPALWKDFPGVLPLNITTKYVYELGVALFAVAFLLHRRRFAKAAGGLLHEYVWTAFLLYYLSPAALFALSIYTTHVFVNRYALWMVIGAGGLVVGLFALAAKVSERTGAVLAGLLMLAVMVAPIRKAFEKPRLLESEDAMKEAIGLPHDNTAIVVADHHVFMELYHYTPERLRNRLVYSLNRDLDIRYLEFDTGALLMDAIRKRDHLPIVDYKEILNRYDRFYVVSSPGHYLPTMLHLDGRRVRVLQADTYSALYLVWADKGH
jgi:hypothetical protein